MRQTTKVKQILLRFNMLQSYDEGNGEYKVTLIDKKDSSRQSWSSDKLPICIEQAHKHFKKETNGWGARLKRSLARRNRLKVKGGNQP